MARYARSRRAKGVSHAMFRGVRKSALFGNDEDRREFLRLLDGRCLKYDVRLLDFTLLTNHAHLIPWATGKDLGDALREVIGIYSKLFNEKYGTEGTIVQGRFKDFPVRSSGGLLRTSQYVQFNAVDAGMVKEPWDYPWSSAPAYAGKPPILECLDTSMVLSLLSRDPARRQEAYFNAMRVAMAQLPERNALRNQLSKAGNNHSGDLIQQDAQLEHALAVRDMAVHVVSQRAELNGQADSMVQLLWAYCVMRWKVCRAWLLSIPMACSAEKVRTLARQGAVLHEQSEQFHTLVDAMERMTGTNYNVTGV